VDTLLFLGAAPRLPPAAPHAPPRRGVALHLRAVPRVSLRTSQGRDRRRPGDRRRGGRGGGWRGGGWRGARGRASDGVAIAECLFGRRAAGVAHCEGGSHCCGSFAVLPALRSGGAHCAGGRGAAARCPRDERRRPPFGEADFLLMWSQLRLCTCRRGPLRLDRREQAPAPPASLRTDPRPRGRPRQPPLRLPPPARLPARTHRCRCRGGRRRRRGSRLHYRRRGARRRQRTRRAVAPPAARCDSSQAFCQAGAYHGELYAPVMQWARSVAAGSLPPTLRSEEPPLDNLGPVVRLVGSTLEPLALRSAADVLLCVHAPWDEVASSRDRARDLAEVWRRCGRGVAGVCSRRETRGASRRRSHRLGLAARTRRWTCCPSSRCSPASGRTSGACGSHRSTCLATTCRAASASSARPPSSSSAATSPRRRRDFSAVQRPSRGRGLTRGRPPPRLRETSPPSRRATP